jgi:hypothetical protein
MRRLKGDERDTNGGTAVCAAATQPNATHPLRLFSAERQSLRAGILLTVGVVLVSVLSGCASRESIEAGRSRGAEAGDTDGKRAGEAEGFDVGCKAAEKSAYSETLSQLDSSGDYCRGAVCTLGVILVAFLLGYALQYLLFYWLRRGGFLSDIDWIVLPQQMAEAIDFTDMAVQMRQTTSTQEKTKPFGSNVTCGE